MCNSVALIGQEVYDVAWIVSIPQVHHPINEIGYCVLKQFDLFCRSGRYFG